MRRIEFLVLSPERERGTTLVLAGRCIDGPICVGDRFDSLQGPNGTVTADLTVLEISAYGQLLNQLDPVVTAELVLRGNRPGSLPDHALLTGVVQ